MVAIITTTAIGIPVLQDLIEANRIIIGTWRYPYNSWSMNNISINASKFIGIWKYTWIDLNNENRTSYTDFNSDGTYGWSRTFKWELKDGELLMPAHGVGNNVFNYSFSNNDNTLTRVSVKNNNSRIYSRVVFQDEASESIIIDKEYYYQAPRDSYKLMGFVLHGDTLRLYGTCHGAVREHQFVLIGLGNWINTNPAITHITLSLDDPIPDNGIRTCVLGSFDIFYDLSPLKEAWQQKNNQESGILFLQIEGFDKAAILYEF